MRTLVRPERSERGFSSPEAGRAATINPTSSTIINRLSLSLDGRFFCAQTSEQHLNFLGQDGLDLPENGLGVSEGGFTFVAWGSKLLKLNNPQRSQDVVLVSDVNNQL